MVNKKIKKLEQLIEEFNFAQLRVDSIQHQMIELKNNIIVETIFKKEYLSHTKCPFEHNALTYKAWKQELIKNHNIKFEDDYVCERGANDMYSCKKADTLESLFEIYKSIYTSSQ